jgi:hypothetical protein
VPAVSAPGPVNVTVAVPPPPWQELQMRPPCCPEKPVMPPEEARA